MMMLLGCGPDKEGSGELPEFIQATIDRGETFTYDFGNIGVEDRLVIESESALAKRVNIERQTNNHSIFTYVPRTDTTGTENIVLSHCVSAGGSECVALRKVVLGLTVR